MGLGVKSNQMQIKTEPGPAEYDIKRNMSTKHNFRNKNKIGEGEIKKDNFNVKESMQIKAIKNMSQKTIKSNTGPIIMPDLHMTNGSDVKSS